MSTLADRIREVLGGAPGPIRPGLPPTVGLGLPSTVGRVLGTRLDPETLEAALGGEWHREGDASCFVVEARRERSSRHGHVAVGALADGLREAADDVPLLAGFPVRAPFLFFDLETTGLSGGAGTFAFLVGCGWFDDAGAFVTRQFMLARLADERALLSSLAAELSRAGALVSFNGRSFDAPLIETRYLYHRLPWTGAALPHLDMLHIARRFWKRRDGAPADPAQESSCSLIALERQLLGHRRHGDVPGFEIPQRYFQFVRSGDARPLAPVFEHNRLDLLSLAALTARAVQLVRTGPGGAQEPREALALGGIYTHAGLDARAREAYERAVELSGSEPSSSRLIRIDCLRALAGALRRSRRFDEAASCWQKILDVRGCPRHVAREANEALAIHHEHRVRDLSRARAFALESLEDECQAARAAAVRHRLERIDRKMDSLKFEV